MMVTKAIQFLSEVKSEVKKVTWPTKKEAMGGTAVVLVVVFIMALFLGLVDLLLSKIIGVIFSA
jgi:preprotein translocase subunit SecE